MNLNGGQSTNWDKFLERDRHLEEYYQRELHSFHSTLMTLSTGGAGVLVAFVPKVYPFVSLNCASKVLFALSLLAFVVAAILFAITKDMDQKQAYRRVEWERAQFEKADEEPLEALFDRVDKRIVVCSNTALGFFVAAMALVFALVLIQLVVDL